MEPENPQFKEWGQSQEMMRLLIRSFRDLDMNVIFVCAGQEQEDERKRRLFLPALPGKLASAFTGFLDFVGFLVAAPPEGGEVKRRLYLSPGQSYKAKNRFRNFTDQYIDNPTMALIWNANK